MGIGAELKEAREAQGLSLDELQESTKIQKRYLQAIEQEKFHILPGKFYARAFIKEYANAVGLDSDTLLEQHQDDVPHTEDESTVQYAHMQRSRRGHNTQKSSKIFSVIPTIVVILLVIGIVFFAWYLVQESNNDDTDSANDTKNNDEIFRNKEPDENNSSEDVNDKDTANSDEESGNADQDTSENADEVNEEASEETESEFTVVEEGTGNSPKSELDFTYDGDDVSLKFESDDATWLEVQTDAENLYSGNLTSENSPKEFDVSEEENVSLNIGNAPSLKVTINGVDMEYPVDEQVVHQRIKINFINENE